jgi:hypothetical protein
MKHAQDFVQKITLSAETQEEFNKEVAMTPLYP